jgi:hypothetical protein
MRLVLPSGTMGFHGDLLGLVGGFIGEYCGGVPWGFLSAVSSLYSLRDALFFYLSDYFLNQ